MLEMARIAPVVRSIASIDFQIERVLSLSFEEIIGDEVAGFGRIYDHFGLLPMFKDRVLRIFEGLAASKRAKTNIRIRSSAVTEWRTVLDESHQKLFLSELK